MSSMTAEEISIGELVIRFLLEGDESGGTAALFEFTVPSSAMVPVAHSHDAYEETIVGVEGVLTWTLDGIANEVGPGDVLLIPRGVVHHFVNGGDSDALALAFVTPGLLGPDYFREVAGVLEASAGGPPDFAALGAVMKKHGLTPA